jgi:transcriptional regulator with XRE-family HTH domain
MARRVGQDLSSFHGDIGWDDRLALIVRVFPAGPLDEENGWGRVLDRDPELMGRILRDILKARQANSGRPGPRPALDMAKAQPIVDTWLGRDPLAAPYTLLPFGDALVLLAQGRSMRHVARLVDMPRTIVHRLMRGEIKPSSEMIVKVSQAFGKKPSYFVEWRIGVIASTIVDALTAMPERSVRAYESLFWTGESRQELDLPVA